MYHAERGLAPNRAVEGGRSIESNKDSHGTKTYPPIFQYRQPLVQMR